MTRKAQIVIALSGAAVMVAVTAVVIIDVAATYPKWSGMAYALPVLSCLTGGLAAFPKFASPSSTIMGFVAQALGAFLLLQVVMVGGGAGSFAWTAGFWLFGALLWIPAYIWTFALFTLFFSVFRFERALEPVAAMKTPLEVEVEFHDEQRRWLPASAPRKKTIGMTAP